jgi:hypothetical protein
MTESPVATLADFPTVAPGPVQVVVPMPVEELLGRARPLPPHHEMAVEDLSEEEGAAFLAAVESERDPVVRLACRGELGLVRESTHDEG